MADNISPYSVKISDSEKERARALAEQSGLTQRAWFTKLLELAEVHSMKENFQEFGADLEELQIHTERIYKCVANVVERSNHLRISEKADLIAKVEKKEQLIIKFQDELNVFKDDVAAAKEAQELAETKSEELEKKLDEMSKNVENTQLLVEEYKQKNEFLTSELMKYQAFEEENGKLKKQLTGAKEQFGQDLQRVEEEKAVLIQQNKELAQSIELQKKQCELAVKEASLNVKSELQGQVTSLVEKHQATVTEYETTTKKMREEYQAEVNKMREEYQVEINKMSEKHQAEIDKMSEKYQAEINKINDANEAALGKQQAGFDKERKTFETKLQALEKQLKAKTVSK